MDSPMPVSATAAPTAPPAPPPAAQRPPEVPEKFWDAEAGRIRVEALLKSYLALERRLSQMVALPTAESGPEDRLRLYTALGRPQGPEEYAIACPHGLFEPDPEINARLFEAGMSQEQAQAVYDLAAEKMVPLMQALVAELEADREIERLMAEFGGPERWAEVSRQMLAWAERNLPADALPGLTTSFDGVMALYEMMKNREPASVADGGTEVDASGERDLQAMLRDPRYWRDRDPAFIAKVTEGFRRLYPERG